MFNGQVQFFGTEPVVLPTKQHIAGIAISSVLGTHQKIEAAMDTGLLKKAGKGWTIYGRSELRSRIQMIGSVVKECNGILEEVVGNEDLEKTFADANDTLGKFQALSGGNKPPRGYVEIPADELRKHLKKNTNEFVKIRTG